MIVAVVLALGSSAANAVHLMARHLASTGIPATVKRLRLLRYLLHQPLWLLGWGAAAAVFALQAAALHYGPLSIVQPLLVAELVFALVLRRVWIRQTVSASAWTSALVVCVSLAVFVTAAEPEGGTAAPNTGQWLGSLVTFGGVVAIFSVLASRGSPTRRAALYASASAIVFALMAAFLKTSTETLSVSGPSAALRTWPVYGIVICGIVGGVLQQAALQTGPLSVSQPLFIVVDPAASILLSLWVFGEHYTSSPLKLTAGLASFAVLVIGVVMMSRTSPPTLAHDGDPAHNGG